MLPWLWKILGKGTFFIQIHQLQGSIHSEATPVDSVLIQAWVTLHVSAALHRAGSQTSTFVWQQKITFIRGIGFLCRCGSPKCLIKPVLVKPMESHDCWDTELRTQQHLRPCPGLFDPKGWNFGASVGSKLYLHPPFHVPFHTFSHWASGDARTARGTRKHAWQCLRFLLGTEGVRWNSGDSRHDVFHFSHSLTCKETTAASPASPKILAHLTPFPPPHGHIRILHFRLLCGRTQGRFATLPIGLCLPFSFTDGLSGCVS